MPGLTSARGASALVTGGAGFVGSRLCDLLHTSGWIVHSVSRRQTGAEFVHQHWQVDLTDSGNKRSC